jgi:ubiquinone/menaquinone biosynthesis C-methylase UbiE
MLSKTSSHITKLYKDDGWKTHVIKIILRVVQYVRISEADVIKIIEKHLISKNADKKIINELRKLVVIPEDGAYEISENIRRAFRKWKHIRPQLQGIRVHGMLDYGGGVGDAAFALGRKILKLKKEKTFVVDVDEFAGITYKPRDDITFVHFDNINELKSKVELITISHVMHHIDPNSYPKILDLFNRILSNNGIIMLYEHNCSHTNMVPIINIEHCLYDVVNSKKLTYDKFVGDFYANYMSIKKWEKLFSKYFKQVYTMEIEPCVDKSFYMFFKRK